jgi:hypothetical protein
MSETCPLFQIPEDILGFIANFLLSSTEEQGKSVFHFSGEWRHFMNTNKDHFGSWKRRSQILTLQGYYAEKFKKSERFRFLVLEKVEDSLFQVELIFKFPCGHPRVSLHGLPRLKRLEFREFFVKSSPIEVEEFILQKGEISDLALILPTVRKLTINNANQKLIDCSQLAHLESFCVSSCQFINYHMLANLKQLEITNVPIPMDVSCFQSIPVLSIIGCAGVIDVSSLGNVHSLTLGNCSGIRDVGALGTVHSLNLNHCDHVGDVTALRNVHSLDLSWCSGVSNIAGLSSVYDLKITGFRGIDLTGLTNVIHLDISYTPNVSDISMLHQLRTLVITKCTGIRDLRGLYHLKELVCDDGIFSFTGEGKASTDQIVSRLTELTLRNSRYMSLQFSSFVNLISLKIEDCKALKGFHDGFPVLRTLFIKGCRNFKTLPAELPASLAKFHLIQCNKLESLDMSGLENPPHPIMEVVIQNCASLKEIHIHRKVFHMKILSCKSLHKIVVKNQIAHLTVEDCIRVTGVVGFDKVVYSSINHEHWLPYDQDENDEDGDEDDDDGGGSPKNDKSENTAEDGSSGGSGDGDNNGSNENDDSNGNGNGDEEELIGYDEASYDK